MRSSGQASAEYMVLMAITLAILTFVIGTTFDTSKDLNRADEILSGKGEE